MICECTKQLHCGSVLTKAGNEIEYMECEACGIVDVMGIAINDTNNTL